MRRSSLLLRVAGLALTLLMSAGRAEASETLVRVRELYLSAVTDESAIRQGLEVIEAMRARGEAPEGSEAGVVLSAYEGALVTLRAKHGVWPPARLRHLREGLVLLDAAVAARPDLAEVRYLRLLSCYFLPGILGRKGSVQEDFAALGRLLPTAREEFPPELYGTMVRFVLEKGALQPEVSASLQAVLEEVSP